MKTLVVYDSKFGNTETIARVIAHEFDGGEPVLVDEVSLSHLADIELLAVGGPTQGHGLSPALRAFFERIPAGALRDVPTVAFDTRVTWPRFLSGSAATVAAHRLAKLGARRVLGPESFLVTGSQGPLVEGELERAHHWAEHVRRIAEIAPPVREPVAAGR